MTPKIILKMSLQAEGCDLKEAVNDVHRAMLGFGQQLHREDRHLEVLFVPDVTLPFNLEDMSELDRAMGVALQTLDKAKERALASREKTGPIAAAMFLLLEQRTRLQLVIASLVEDAPTLSEPKQVAVNLG